MSREHESLKAVSKEINTPFVGSLLAVCLLLNTSQAAQAQMSGISNEDFQQIEQPLGLKIGVSTAGIGLIGFELWWFLFSKSKKQSELPTTDVAALPLESVAVADLENRAPEDRALESRAPENRTPVPAQSLAEQSPAEKLETEQSLAALPNVAAPQVTSQTPRRQTSYKTLVDLSIAYGGMQMSQCLMMVQDQMRPKFSVGLRAA